MDPNYAHEFIPNRQGKCQMIVSGKICHLEEAAPVHTRAAAPAVEEECIPYLKTDEEAGAEWRNKPAVEDGTGIYYAGGKCKVCGGDVYAYSQHVCPGKPAVEDAPRLGTCRLVSRPHPQESCGEDWRPLPAGEDATPRTEQTVSPMEPELGSRPGPKSVKADIPTEAQSSYLRDGKSSADVPTGSNLIPDATPRTPLAHEPECEYSKWGTACTCNVPRTPLHDLLATLEIEAVCTVGSYLCFYYKETPELRVALRAATPQEKETK